MQNMHSDLQNINKMEECKLAGPALVVIFVLLFAVFIWGLIIESKPHRYIVKIEFCNDRPSIIDTLTYYGETRPTIKTHHESSPVIEDMQNNTLYVNVCQLDIIKKLD